jgi:sec-independent protein translocase protein TatA
MGLGWQELVIVLVIVVIIFGAGKLPEIGGSLGKGIKEFRASAQDGMGDAPASKTTTTTTTVSEEL